MVGKPKGAVWDAGLFQKHCIALCCWKHFGLVPISYNKAIEANWSSQVTLITNMVSQGVDAPVAWFRTFPGVVLLMSNFS